MNQEKVIMCWSGGKDSAYTLYKLMQSWKYEVVCLLTTINSYYQRVSMHGVRENLLDQQARSIGIPLEKVYVSQFSSNEEYEQKMKDILTKYQALGVQKVIFGDIFLEDLREYREKNLAKVGLKGEFPLWKQNTRALIDEFITLGFETITCCVEDRYLNKEMVGRLVDQEFINALPPVVDPCGENGEFHTFTYAGPIFKEKICFNMGEIIYKPLEINKSDNQNQVKGFWYCDLCSVV